MYGDPQPSRTAPDDFSSEHTSNFAELLSALQSSLLVSTYQAGKLIHVRADGPSLNTHFRDFDRPMGLAYHEGRLALGTRREIWHFRNFPKAARSLPPAGRHDALFLPAQRLITGSIRIHELAFAGEELWAVNTYFSCLSTFDGVHSFVPRWRPPFVSKFAAEDRCHLNGLAMREGIPAFVTCHGTSDAKAGWRDDKAHGGCIVDVASGELVARGLSMPHSPRWHAGKLWCLNSGHGTLCTVDLASGQTDVVATLPGFTRGLDFLGQFAFVGLSQVRESSVFGGLPISDPARERHCGVWVVDLTSGQTVAFLRFSGSVQEIFAVQLLPGILFPELLNESHPIMDDTYLVPDEALDEMA